MLADYVIGIGYFVCITFCVAFFLFLLIASPEQTQAFADWAFNWPVTR